MASPVEAQRLPDCNGLTSYEAIEACRNDNQRAIWLVEALAAELAKQQRAAEERQAEQAGGSLWESTKEFFVGIKDKIMGFF